MVRIILGKTHCKLLIDILRICRAKGDFHIHTSSIYAIQTNYILKSNILIFCLICAKILNFPNRFLDQAASAGIAPGVAGSCSTASRSEIIRAARFTSVRMSNR